MMVVTIMIIMTSIIGINYSSFTSETVLANTAYEIGLLIREAQVSALGVKSGGSTFNLSYGVHFDSSKKQQVIFFRDYNQNGAYDCSGGSGADCSESKTYDIKNKIQIESICVKLGEDPQNKGPLKLVDGKITCRTTDSLHFLDITFARPDPDAIIVKDNQGVTQKLPSGAVILETTDHAKQSVILVLQAGQITVPTKSVILP